jgi:hypothetical protein
MTGPGGAASSGPNLNAPTAPGQPFRCDATNLADVSNDEFCFTLQWLHAHSVPEADRPGVFGEMVQQGSTVWEGDEEIPALVGHIITNPRLFPTSVYPHFTTHQISTAYALWARNNAGLTTREAEALAAAHANGNKDPRP